MYEKNVFINCPFDEAYVDLLHAITFAISYSGFIPRSALEEVNSGEERLAKIVKLIKDCRLAVHDISRVELPATDALPRFNMPFECGIFYGALSLGDTKQRQKQFLVLDSEPFRYQKTLSDIAGKDPACHRNDPYEAVACVRRFLNGKGGAAPLPGETHFTDEYRKFQSALPALLQKVKLTPLEIRKMAYWTDYAAAAQVWIERRASDPAST